MSSQIPSFYLTIPEIIDTYCAHMLTWAQKTDIVKSDGAIDEIPLKSSKKLINVEDLLINTKTQRVDAIVCSNIQKNLEDFGGFSHKNSGTIDTFVSKLYGHSSPDGMHRAIMAYICGVKQIAIVEQNEHAEDASEEDMCRAELEFFQAKNERSAKVTKSSTLRVRKLTNTMTEDEAKLDHACAEVNVHVNDFGCSKDTATLVYPNGHDNIKRLIVDVDDPYYLGVKEFSRFVALIQKVGSGKSQFDGALAFCASKFNSVLWKKFMSSEDFLTKVIEPGEKGRNYWVTNCQHGAGMETAVIRLALHFNQWYRNEYGHNILEIDMFDAFIRKMNMETYHFIHACLVKGVSVEKELLKFEEVVSV